MKRSSRLVVLVLGLLLLVTVGTITADEPEQPSVDYSSIRPLWEPTWSPVGLSIGDTPVHACEADLGGNGVKEVVILGLEDVHHLVRDDRGDRLYRLMLGSGFSGWEGALGGSSIESGDLNGDGRDDLVVTTRGDGIWVFLRQYNLAFKATTEERIQPGGRFLRAWLADHTGDGILDLLIPDHLGASGWLSVLPGDGEGNFGEAFTIDGFDAELQDAYIIDSEEDIGIWLISHGDAWFLPQGAAEAELRITNGGNGITVADYDNDGDLDVCMAGVTIRVYWNEAGQYQMSLWNTDYIAQTVDHGDVDGDGDLDLVVWNRSPAEISVLYNLGDAFERVEYAVGYTDMPEPTMGGICSDVTGDGIEDIVSLHFLQQMSVLSVEQGKSVNQAMPGGYLVGQMDIDGDDQSELLVDYGGTALSSLTFGPTGIAYTTPLVRQETTERSDFDWWTLSTHAADLNGDGSETLVIWEEKARRGQYLSGWHEEDDVWRLDWEIPLEGSTAPRLGIGDVDGDGQDEMLVANGMQVDLYELEGDAPARVDQIPWGSDVGPYTMARLPWGERIVGFRAAERVTEALWLDADGAHETGIELPAASPLDIVAEDLDGDGVDELVYVALAVRYEDESPYLAMEVGIFGASAIDHWEDEGVWKLEDWPIETVPYPFGGLAVVDADEKRIRMALSFAATATVSGGIAWIELPGDGSQQVHVTYQACAIGPELFRQWIGDEPHIISMTSTVPETLRLMRWPE